jgi:hypothetical protein
MAPLQNVIPIRWSSGPLEIARRGKAEGFTPELKQALERFHDPASLDILKDSPIDCLVISWAAGLPEDAEQQKSAAPLVDAARKRNLTVVGWVDAAANAEAAIAAAKAAGLAAVVVENYKGKSTFPVIPYTDRAHVPWGSTAPVLAIGENVWPGVSMPDRGADAGPTSSPWIDSNAWYIQLAQARTRMPLWIPFDPPSKGRMVPASAYPTAIADTEAGGARWIISLDANLQAGLASGNRTALATFKSISDTAGFFQKRAAWKTYHSRGVCGVVSDFTGDNFEMSGEILNLLAKRNLQFRPIWKARAATASFAGLRSIIYADTQPPAPELRAKLMSFAELGGLLITGPKWGPEGKAITPPFATQFELRSLGKGRLAVAKDKLTDSYQVAVDAQLLTSRGADLAKLYNASSCLLLFTASPDAKKAVLHVIGYATGRNMGSRTAWVARKYGSARLVYPGVEGAPIKGIASEEYFGMEYQIPETAPGYFAIEFEA